MVAAHVHKYDEDGDCLVCAHDQWAPKPDPGARMVSWPVLIWSRVWCYLSWPWQVRQMKRYGFRRVGWMTWETGPEPPGADVSPLPDPPMQDLPGPTLLTFDRPVPRDVMEGVREAMTLVGRMRPRRELHCTRDVTEALSYDPPNGFALTRLFGIDVVVEGDMSPGRWELREGDTVVGSGQIEQEG